MVDLWWSDNPVSIVVLFRNILSLFVRIRSIVLGLCGFLKQVDSYIKLLKLKVLQKLIIIVSIISEFEISQK